MRGALFLATFLLTWLTVDPFPNLADPHLLDPVAAGTFAGQAAVLLLTAALTLFLLLTQPRLAWAAVTPLLVVTLAWFAVSVVLSANAGLAGRRLVLALCMIVGAIAFVLLPVSREHFARLLAAAALIVLALCYFGVAVIPARAIHQAGDLLNSDLVGDWRGPFAQKNGAGAAMVILIFMGLFVARVANAGLGIAIIALAAVFLVFTAAKSSIALLPVMLVASAVLMSSCARGIKIAIAVGLPAFLHLATIGSVLFAPVKAMLGLVMPDVTFTNRDQIWAFALEQITARPIFGAGFQAFWGTSDLMAGATESWVYATTDAHNALLNLALMVGLVGTVLALLWVTVQPLRDLLRVQQGQSDRALTTLLVQIWLFGNCLSAFESVLFAGGSGLWFLMIAAIVALRFQTLAALRA
ncbi:MAG: O-antigen ligase family protein [Variibacter sp.]|nr:O-antigen ligase family protein [Variibacter sp.]